MKYGINKDGKESKPEDEMKKRPKDRWFLPLVAVQFFLVLLFVLYGCSTTQDRSNHEESYEKVPFSEIIRAPKQYRGKVVRLGGVIIDVVNEEKGSTIEIVEQPLNWRGRPKVGDVPGGRFLVVSEKFLDKAIYQPKREVTVVGEIIDKKVGQIGEATYTYPVLSLRDIRLWKSSGYSGGSNLRIGVGVSGGSGGGAGGVGVGASF
jgi:outer membrane lipoprotein